MYKYYFKLTSTQILFPPLISGHGENVITNSWCGTLLWTFRCICTDLVTNMKWSKGGGCAGWCSFCSSLAHAIVTTGSGHDVYYGMKQEQSKELWANKDSVCVCINVVQSRPCKGFILCVMGPCCQKTHRTLKWPMLLHPEGHRIWISFLLHCVTVPVWP